ncbi:RING/FYVE/PHD zinc finger superfamily protein, putative isoform 1 [Cinnamomum micranthum f. kanehirae]|uniref:RING/FYVE/PHD zinc finger superfamily protein, putative isoform 1 n=1 Tax=Cinnamomum micranthum f. kanehirae TaxID=337451 RepID=A0A3S3NYM7_9MAGN|nr:RING/FYVE/PHD zinc finger superfamily protein, putative isoform 1 [Cinnamomum micranthum f. kanehirae]
MLQLLFAVAFSAAPLTLYVPPVRSLNLFVETIENLLRQTTVYTVRAYPRIRHAWARVLASLLRIGRFIFFCFGTRETWIQVVKETKFR